jgi:hypothetical protein
MAMPGVSPFETDEKREAVSAADLFKEWSRGIKVVASEHPWLRLNTESRSVTDYRKLSASHETSSQAWKMRLVAV